MQNYCKFYLVQKFTSDFVEFVLRLSKLTNSQEFIFKRKGETTKAPILD